MDQILARDDGRGNDMPDHQNTITATPAVPSVPMYPINRLSPAAPPVVPPAITAPAASPSTPCTVNPLDSASNVVAPIAPTKNSQGKIHSHPVSPDIAVPPPPPGNVEGVQKTSPIPTPGEVAGCLSNPGIDDVARALTEVSERKLDCDHPVEAKPFPLEVLPDSLGNYVQSAAASIGCEEAMIAVPLLAGLSGTIGNTYHVEVTSSWRSSCMLWTMILALSGSGKSPALDLAIKPIRELAADFDREFETKRAQYKAEVVGYERQVKAARKNGNNPGPEPVRPVRRRIDFHDATVEALAQVLSKNTRGGVLIADEIAVWLHGLNMYKSGGRGTDMAKWNEIWNGNTLRIDRKTGDERELHVARPFMAVTGGIQTGVFLQHVDRDSLDSGMLARILVTVSTSIKRPGNRQPVDRQLYQSVLCTYRKLARLDFIRTSDSERPRYIPLCPEALTRFHDWREHWEAETARILNDGIAATMTKLVSYVPRFALILHLTQRVQSNQASTGFTPIETIDLDTVNKAICLAEWFGNEARRVHALVKIPSTTHEELREKILEVVDAKGGWMSVRDVCREHRETRATEARMVLEELASRRLLERRQPAGSTTGRRPGPEFRSISAT